jgi:hypothetical protein
LKEIAGRTKNINSAGVNRVKLHTAFREKSIKIACVMESVGSVSAKELVNNYHCAKGAYGIIYKNHYGWFKKVDKGIYALSSSGYDFLNGIEFKELIDYYRNTHKEKVK